MCGEKFIVVFAQVDDKITLDAGHYLKGELIFLNFFSAFLFPEHQLDRGGIA